MTGILIRNGKVGPRYRHRRTSRDHGSRNPNQGIPIVLAEVYVIYYNVIINIQIYEIHRSVDDVRLYVIIVPRVIHTIYLIIHRDLPWQIWMARISRKECIDQKGWPTYPQNRTVAGETLTLLIQSLFLGSQI